jgi:urocanate reductase
VSVEFDHEADVVVVGAGGAGLPAALAARCEGVAVVCIDENHDVGGHAILSAGRLALGGGTSIQSRYGVDDSADQVYRDFTCAEGAGHRFTRALRYADRELVRAWANECAPTVEFLLEHGVVFKDGPPTAAHDGTMPGSVPRVLFAEVYSDDLAETILGYGGSGIVRPLERSARERGVAFLLEHRLTRLFREPSGERRVIGVRASHRGRDVHIRARRGIVLATGGHSSNVPFRRMFDPRLTEEYQVAGEAWSRQSADGELLAMELGAALWSVMSQRQGGLELFKTAHIGCREGYSTLKWRPDSPAFAAAGGSGLTVADWQDVILVDRTGRRFWNELDDSEAFLDACLAPRGTGAENGGGPIWAIFDQASVMREHWDPRPPHVDERGWFFRAGSLEELAACIDNRFQCEPMSQDVLRETVERYNRFVDSGCDEDFGKPAPQHRIESPPFYAAWSTPILHDSLTGLRTDARSRVIDLRGEPIVGLYCAGEAAGGFGYHGLPRAVVFGRVAGREAARDGSAAYG